MSPSDLEALLRDLKAGKVEIGEALKRLSAPPFEDLGFAKIDHHRQQRTGLPEVVYGPGKTAAELAKIFESLRGANQTALATRVEEAKAKAAIAAMSPTVQPWARYEAVPRLLHAGPPLVAKTRGTIAVVAAGTSDQPVSEEAARTLEIFGHPVERITDVGVAGLHRLIAVRDRLEASEVVIVVAGMEGALPSVVKGLISRPVIAVPTSVGFGAHFEGVVPLLAMLSSCASGVTVVNVDNGFGAACAAALINTVRG
jgi:pyridinium-3,5-biscarboxylic acid mononucleotide synthase